MRTRAAVWAAALAAVAVAPAPAFARPSLPALEQQLFCVTCKIPLVEARSPQAESERSLIRRLLSEGKSEAQIKQALVAEYGPAVLGLPRASGVDLLVYVVPIAVVALAALAVYLALRHWRSRPQPADEPFALQAPLSAEQRLALQRELDRFSD